MKLELISKVQEKPKAQIIFLHGACLGTWIWEKHFMPYFFENGFNVHAFNFRNHGKSEGIGSLRWNSIQDYVEDLEQIIASLEGPIILIGHSMGGMTIQHYLKNTDSKVKAAVMLCAVPRQGVWSLIGKLLLEHPLKFLESTLKASWLPILQHPKRLKQLMLRKDFPESEIKSVQAKLQDESFWAFLQMLFNRPKVPQNHIPILVVAGDEDYLFPVSQSLSLAKTYQAKSFILNQGSHSLMMETDWEKAADQILEFWNDLY